MSHPVHRMNARVAIAALRLNADPKKATFFPRFFKTAKGEYGFGDQFLGVTVPEVRSVAKIFGSLLFPEIRTLFLSPLHEVRMLGFMILVSQYEKGDEKQKKKIVAFYLQNLKRANNWDLVDLSAYKILGHSLIGNDQTILLKLAASNNLWEQRVSVVSTFALIRAHDYTMILRLAEKFLSHTHDLMHKVVGWMLREVGKRDKTALTSFLNKHAANMPRTMLRYAIEKMNSAERKRYLEMR